jgi:tetratricopeptide (TPR) repeat protein
MWAGMSYREVHSWVARLRRSRGLSETPSYSTVYRAFQPGRSRLEVELVVDIARVLLADETEAAGWRRAHQVIAGRAHDAATVSTFDSLPVERDDFVGRTAELEQIVGLVGGAECNPVLISGIEGMAGVGKTRLALRAAHKFLDLGRFAELQLAVNLRGFDPDRAPADPSAVLGAFLRQLGISGDQVHRLDAKRRAAAYRELLAGKDALVFLDNAASEDQVGPLLSDSPGCLVLITSRRRLENLPGIQRLPLDVLSPDEALDMLRRSAGRERVDAELDCANRITEAVGYLPLGLSLAASRLRTKPDWTLADHLEQHLEHRKSLRLDEALEGSIDLSYRSVTPEQQRLLRLASLLPGRDFDNYAAAALAGERLTTIDQWLADLCISNLLEQRVASRYEMHDVVRTFAASRALDEDAPSTRRDAMTRLLEQYRYTVARAMDLYAPHEAHRRPSFPDPGLPTAQLEHSASATAWLEAERANLIASVIHAAEHGHPDFASDLSTLLHRYLDTTAQHHDAEILHGCASRVAVGADKARAMNRLGTMHARLGQYQEALDRYQQALQIFREVGDRPNEGRALNNLGIAHERLGRYLDALEHYQQALSIAQEAGDRIDLGRTLSNLGLVYVRLGRYGEASTILRDVVSITRDVGNRAGESYALTHLAIVHARRGDHAKAAENLRRALAISQQIANRTGESYALTHLGTACARLGLHEEALSHHRLSVTIAREDSDREAEAEALNEMGNSLCHLGRAQEALECHQEALVVTMEVGDRYQEARSHHGIAESLASTTKANAAQSHWKQALDIFTELDTPEAELVTTRLRQIRAS